MDRSKVTKFRPSTIQDWIFPGRHKHAEESSKGAQSTKEQWSETSETGQHERAEEHRKGAQSTKMHLSETSETGRHERSEEHGKGAESTTMQLSEKSEIMITSHIVDSMSVLKDNVKSKLDIEEVLRSSLSFPRFGNPPVAAVKDVMKSDIDIGETGVPPLQRNEAKRTDAAGFKETGHSLSVQVAGVSIRGAAECDTIPFRRSESASMSAVKEAMKSKVEIAETEAMPPQAKPAIERTVQKILGVMKEATARMIGVYGMGGIGKTTVLKALTNNPETKSMFDLIIWVPVFRYFSRRMIQNEVARQLSLCPRDSEADNQVATKILQTLKRQKFLLLLDDVWEKIDLAAVGIPESSQEKGCRIILTARSFGICNVMTTDRAIEVELVSREEAWQLFLKQVGGVLDCPKIMNIAQEIVKECDGLPLTIIVTGKALRNENDALVWEHALSQFQHRSKPTEHEAAIRGLEFSYDRLKDRDIKRCFLHCALVFAKDHEIKVDGLIENFIEDDLIHGSSSRARKKGQDILKNLIDSSLLEKVNGGLSLRMPGMVKDLGLWIISSKIDDCQFFTRTGVQIKKPLKEEPYQGSITEDVILSGAGAGLTKPPPEKVWEGKEMIFLMNNDFSRLPKEPNCPNLLTLFLQKNRLLRSIPLSFFNAMPSLRALNLSKTGIRSLPPLLFKLTELQVLILRHCNCLDELPPEVGNLEHIEVLDLQGTELYNLPDEVGELTSLRHLQISFYEAVDQMEYDVLPCYLVSRHIISKLIHLQELHIVVHRGDQRWNESAEDITHDVRILNKLTSLEFYFPNVNVLNLFIKKSQPWISNSLSKFKFIVGQSIRRNISRVPDDIEFDYDQQDRCLRFVNCENIPDAVLEVLGRATAFYLDNHSKIQSLSEFGMTYIKELKFCILRECPNILAVIDSEENSEIGLQYLEHLSIHYLWKLKSICKGPLPLGSFNGLKFLSVHKCPKLEIILEESMLQCLSNLEELVVERCASLRKITEMEEKTENDDFVVLPSLRKLSLLFLPQLVSIWNGVHSEMEINICHCPKLEDKCPKLEIEA